MKTLFSLNDAPYGSERSYNGMRLAGALARFGEQAVQIFLMGDAVSAAHRGQQVPAGHYNMESLLEAIVRHGADVGVCGSCLDARGIGAGELVEGPRRGNLVELARWTAEADQVLVF
jgi:uncharacterized protein involved in oxidation of intracellular sulfur